MIILSEETIKGGELINDKRKTAGLKPLDILPIPLLEEHKFINDCCAEEEKKISSSNYRMRLLGTLLKPPQVINKKIVFLNFFNNTSILMFSQIIISLHCLTLLD